MKVIDLLNKIANGEEVPKKIEYIGLIYEYDEKIKDYFNDNLWLFYSMNSIGLIEREVEIIEDTPISKLYVNNELQYDLTPKENNKIKHIGKIYDITNFKNDYPEVAKLLNDIANKQYEIIDYINKGNSNE